MNCQVTRHQLRSPAVPVSRGRMAICSSHHRASRLRHLTNGFPAFPYRSGKKFKKLRCRLQAWSARRREALRHPQREESGWGILWRPPAYSLFVMHCKCASGCVVECRICNREVAGSNLSLGYFAPRSTQPSIPPGLVNEYQLRLGRQRPVWLIPIADERVGVQVKLWNPLRTHAIPERFCRGDSLQRGAISSVCTFTFYLYLSIVFVVLITCTKYEVSIVPKI